MTLPTDRGQSHTRITIIQSEQPSPFYVFALRSLSPELESLSPGSSLHSVSPVSFASNNSVETNNNESSKAQIMEKIIYVPTKKVGYLIGYSFQGFCLPVDHDLYVVGQVPGSDHLGV